MAAWLGLGSAGSAVAGVSVAAVVVAGGVAGVMMMRDDTPEVPAPDAPIEVSTDTT